MFSYLPYIVAVVGVVLNLLICYFSNRHKGITNLLQSILDLVKVHYVPAPEAPDDVPKQDSQVAVLESFRDAFPDVYEMLQKYLHK